LWANSIFCALCGLLLAVGAEPIATFLGWSTFVPLIIICIGLLLYSAQLLRRLVRRPVDALTGMVYAIADTVWVVASVILLLTGWVPFTTGGEWAMVIQAIIVADFAILEFLGARRIK
jgi:hypothetical protein